MAKKSSRRTTIFRGPFTSYRSVRIIGEGGAGSVHLVESEGEEYALKHLRSKTATSEKLKRFKNEIEFCRNNPHPNIVEVVDVGRSGNPASPSM